MEAIADLKKLITAEPSNKEARALLKQAQAGQEEDKKSKGLFANMCKALGKGPIPEPGRAAPIGGFGDDDMGEDFEDEDVPMASEDKPSEEGKIDKPTTDSKMDVDSTPITGEEPA